MLVRPNCPPETPLVGYVTASPFSSGTTGVRIVEQELGINEYATIDGGEYAMRVPVQGAVLSAAATEPPPPRYRSTFDI